METGTIPNPVCVAWDAWRATRGDPVSLAKRQRARLASLIAYAKTRSSFYRRRCGHLSAAAPDFSSLPPVSKQELMENFDEWVTDPAVTRDGVEKFVGDRSLIGARYLGRYTVFATSGTTGRPAVFVHDRGAASVYLALAVVRRFLPLLSPPPCGRSFGRGAGRPSYTTLLTNLANRVQPIVRYDLGDSITEIPGPCPCGSPLPTIQAEGRRDEILHFRSSSGETVPLLPMALATVVEENPGVCSYQLVQTGPGRLRIRLEAAPGHDRARAGDAVADRLRRFLSAHGLEGVVVEVAQERPIRDPRGGKLRQIFADM